MLGSYSPHPGLEMFRQIMRLLWRIRATLTIAPVVSLCCTDVAENRNGISVVSTDSAGVTLAISEHELALDTPGWYVSPRPVLEMSTGITEDGPVIHWIRGAVRLSDGRLAVISESAHQLLLLAPDGRVLRAVGREGDGPGEFRRPFHLSRIVADTLVIADRRLDRLTWFDSEGDFVRQLTPSKETLRSVVPRDQAIGTPQYLAPGYVLFWAHARGLSTPGKRTRAPEGFVILRPDGTPVYRGGFLGQEQYRTSEGTGRYAFFSHRTFTAVGTQSSLLYVGDSDGFEIREFGFDGTLRRIIRDMVPPTAITDRDVAWERWELLGWASKSGRTEELRKFAAAMPLPDHKPAFERLIVDTQGYLWAKEYASYKPERVLHRIYSPAGKRVGGVMLPGRFDIFEIGPDYILGVEWDLDYVETIQLFALRRPEPHGDTPAAGVRK